MKISKVFIFVVMFAALVSGQIIQTSDVVRENGYAIINNETYKIVNQEKVYFFYDGKMIEQERIFIQNIDKINNLTKTMELIESKIQDIQSEIDKLNELILEKTEEKEKLDNRINKTEEQINKIKSEIEKQNQTLNTIQQEKMKIVETLTENFILTKTQSYALSTLFLVLIITSIVLEVIGKSKEKKTTHS